MEQQKEKIKTYYKNNCYLCQSSSTNLYQDLEEILGIVSGKWNLRQCNNKDCGLVWVDPCPIEQEIGKLYPATYFNEYGSENTPKSLLKKLYDLYLQLIYVKPERQKIYHMYLEGVKPGKLLEVGCGNGTLLGRFKALGWDVQGQDVSNYSAALASETYKVPVYTGSLKNADFAAASYDAIVMSHVIEHVVDPIELLTECYRILKPKGILMITTPNILSYGHQCFKSYWIPLDPPRHLHLFSEKTLQIVAAKAGFTQCQTWTTSAHAGLFSLLSLDFQKKDYYQGHNTDKNYLILIRSAIFQLQAKLKHLISKSSGDECVLKALK